MKKDLKLSDIPKRNVHGQVPEGYFDRLPMHIMVRTAAQEQVDDTVWYAQWWRPVRYALAPLILLLLFVGIYSFNIQQEPQAPVAVAPLPPVSVASLSDEEIVNYLDSYARVETMDLEEHLGADQRLASDFLNVSASAAEEELEYYKLNDIDY